MMEALAIGLAVYGGVATGAAVYFWSRLDGADWKARVSDASSAFWEDSYRDAVKRLAAFDHDGDGKPGGSKPRGKG